jgi:DNA invertase Pin-like site-specific DNA recombinase
VPATAYSYLRFSSPEQAKGDSLRRQTEARDHWLATRSDVTLDGSLVMTDAGRSAYKRKDWPTYALAMFLKHIEAGRVRPGSYLLVENLDRLSREYVGKATELFLGLVNRGVVVVQLLPVIVEFRDPVDMGALMMAVVELARGHSESAMKSQRGAAVWKALRTKAAQGVVVSGKLPHWFKRDDRGVALLDATGKPQIDQAKAAVIRRIYHLAREGRGSYAIARLLNSEQVPFVGRTLHKGRVVKWSEESVYYLLTTRAVIGEYQPHRGRSGDRHPVGDALADYYPPVIEPALFYAVAGTLKARASIGRGRRGRRVNLFAGLLVDARTGGGFTYRHIASRPATIIPIAAKKGHGSRWTCFPAEVFETAILSQLVEVPAAEVWRNGDAIHRVEELAGRLAEVENLIGLWTAKMDNPALVDVVARKLAELHGRRQELAGELETAQQQVANPLSESWGEFRSLADVLAQDNADEVRLRVKGALQRTIAEMVCLIVARGKKSRKKWAAVQVYFQGGHHEHRDYLVWSRGAARGSPAASRCGSLTDVAEFGPLDLRKPEHARRLEAALLRLSDEALAEL